MNELHLCPYLLLHQRDIKRMLRYGAHTWFVQMHESIQYEQWREICCEHRMVSPSISLNSDVIMVIAIELTRLVL